MWGFLFVGWWVDFDMIKIELTKRNTALITGFSIILMAVAAGYSVGNVFGSLVVADNDNLTTENIINDISLFKTWNYTSYMRIYY